jgi:RimJ/RimL family protein N-acetyltransferase
MIKIETDRMLGLSDMSISEGKLVGAPKREIIDLLTIPVTTGREDAFRFYLKDQPDVEVCHIGFTPARDRFEISYGTELEFRKKGYMTEALQALTEWIFVNTAEGEIWGLPNGQQSQRILERCGYSYCKEDTSYDWYVKRRSDHEG